MLFRCVSFAPCAASLKQLALVRLIASRTASRLNCGGETNSIDVPIHRAMTDTASRLLALEGAVDTFYYLFVGSLVFFMQAGFGLLEAGSVRTKNTKNILLKNLLDACMGAMVWWAWGYAAAVNLPLLRPARRQHPVIDPPSPALSFTRPNSPLFRSTRRARPATSSSAARTRPRASSPPASSASPRRGG